MLLLLLLLLSLTPTPNNVCDVCRQNHAWFNFVAYRLHGLRYPMAAAVQPSGMLGLHVVTITVH